MRQDRGGVDHLVAPRRYALDSVVVGADGLTSRIARSVGAPIIDRRHDQGSCRYAYYAGVSLGRTELHLGDKLLAGVFPTHDGLANVWGTTPDVLAASACGPR